MLVLRAEAKMASSDFEAAVNEATAAAEKLPNSARVHALLSLALYRTSKLAEAKDAIAKAVSLDPATPDYRIAQARILSETGDHAEALKVADEVLAKLPRNPIMHAVRGQALAADGKASLALEAYETALKIEPRYLRVLKLTGDLYASIGTNDLALQYYTKALDAVPQDEIETRIQAEAKDARAALIDKLSKASGGG
jgi:tetratricopeptide (TPR) repeat protein